MSISPGSNITREIPRSAKPSRAQNARLARSRRTMRDAGTANDRWVWFAPELRPHGQLDLAAARLHARKRLRQGRPPDFFGDQIPSRNIPAPDCFHGPAKETRRV